MYQIINVLTQNTISAETRDALFAEVDNLNARIKDGQESGVYKVVLINDEGEILDTAFLEFPLKAYVDEILKDFGTEKATKGKKRGGFLPHFPSFGKNKLTPTAQPTNTLEEVLDAPEDDETLTVEATEEETPWDAETSYPDETYSEENILQEATTVSLSDAADGAQSLVETSEPTFSPTAPPQVETAAPTIPPTFAPTEAPQPVSTSAPGPSSISMAMMKSELALGIQEEIKRLDKEALAILNHKQELVNLLENLQNTPL